MLEFLQMITGIFVVVYDGQHALKFHLGRAIGVVGPGVHFKIPIIQRFQVQPTKDTTLDLEPQVIQLSDELVYEVGAKVVYQIVDLRKAVVEVDNLVEGLKNRLVIIVQNVVKAQDRTTIRDMPRMVDDVKQALRPVEQQWGIKVHEFGFSTFSPTPETLEITQLQKLADEKLSLYRQFHDEQKLSSEAAVSLISGAVMALPGGNARVPEQAPPVPAKATTSDRPASAPPRRETRAPMSLNSLFNLSFRILRWVWHILLQQAQQHPWAVLAGLYGVARAFGVMIQSGQRGILFRWGRVVKELEPGFHWLVPLMHTARKTAVRSVTMVLPNQKVMTADGLVYDVARELRLPGRRCDQGPDLGRSPRYRLPVRDSDRRHRDPQTT